MIGVLIRMLAFMLGKNAVQSVNLMASSSVGAFAKLMTYKIVLFGGKVIIVTVKVVGGTIVGLIAAHEIFGF